MATSNSFDPIGGRNVLAGSQFNNTTINFGDQKDSLHDAQAACQAIHFPRNNDFVRRSGISAQLERLLPPRTEYQSAALWGLGGAGKTQLALEYAYGRCANDSSCSVFWVHADTETSFAQDYKWIATKLGLAGGLDGDKLLKAVRAAIEGLSQWVMVLDNADDLSLFGVRRNPRLGRSSATDGAGNGASDGGVTDLSAYIPRGNTGTVLWTSRDQQIVGSHVGPGHGINVVRMTDAEAESLFQAMSVLEIHEGDEGHDDLLRLLAELGWLPLAISQAAAYIRRTKISIGEYVERIQQRKKRQKILKRSEHDRHRRPEVSNSVLETWDISMEYIKRENRMAYDILAVLAYVDNQNIPYAIMARIAEMRNDEKSDDSDEEISSPGFISRGGSESNGRESRNSDESDSGDDNEDDNEDDSEDDDDDVIEALARLEEFSFVTLRPVQTSRKSHGDRVYDMHKLVQEAILYHLHIQNAKMEAQSAKMAFKITDMLFPKQWHRQNWDWCEQMLGHAQRAGEWARLHNEGKDFTYFLSRISDYLYDRGRWREREMVDMAMFKLRERILGKSHPDTLTARARLGVTIQHLGRHREAEKIHAEMLSLQREILGDKHLDTIDSMAYLAATYYNSGRYKEAEKMEVEALSLRREILGDKHRDTIWSMASLAATYHAQRRYNEAEKIKVEVLSLRREVLGDNHPDTIESMASLAATYHKQRRYKEAEKIQLEVLSLNREILGDMHPNTIRSMASLATTYFSQLRYAEAERIEVEIPKLRQQILGSKHPDTLQAMANLADTYRTQKKYQEAEEIYVKLVQMRREVLGKQHLDTIKSMACLATTYFSQLRYAEAERIEVEIPKLRQQILGSKHPDTLQAMDNLADTYHAQEKYQEAEDIYVKLVQMQREVLGEQHPDTIKSVSRLDACRRALEALLKTDSDAGSELGSDAGSDVGYDAGSELGSDIETNGVSVAGLSLE